MLRKKEERTGRGDMSARGSLKRPDKICSLTTLRYLLQCIPECFGELLLFNCYARFSQKSSIAHWRCKNSVEYFHSRTHLSRFHTQQRSPSQFSAKPALFPAPITGELLVDTLVLLCTVSNAAHSRFTIKPTHEAPTKSQNLKNHVASFP